MTGFDLALVWEDRDLRYHTRPKMTRHMEKAEVDAIRLVRKQELAQATEPGLIWARRCLLSWEPPFQEKLSAKPQAIADITTHPLAIVSSPTQG
jgi:hypothetical protein